MFSVIQPYSALSAHTASATDVNNQLWTIEVETVDGSNRFVLKNKATGLKQGDGVDVVL